ELLEREAAFGACFRLVPHEHLTTEGAGEKVPHGRSIEHGFYRHCIRSRSSRCSRLRSWTMMRVLMTKRDKLSEPTVDDFLRDNAGWRREANTLVKTFELDSYARGIAFAVELGFAAEKRDHHPDITIGWRKVSVGWSTHDAGGITQLD